MVGSSPLVLLVCAFLVTATAVDAAEYKKVKCHDKSGYPLCGDTEFTCPESCPHSCIADCELCRPVCYCNKPGGVCQDPRFVGGDGITFYFHGKKEQDFCLLSDSDLHINAHFIGKRGPSMTRDFTWVQSIAILFDGHRLYIGAQKTAAWDEMVDRLAIAFDGSAVFLPAKQGAKWESSEVPSLSVKRSNGANAVTVEVVGKFKITANIVPITEEESRVHRYGINPNEDCFAHLELGFKFYSLTKEVHGVLGQTYREDYVSKVKVSANMPVMGGEQDFTSSNLYAADCKVSRYALGGKDDGIEMVSELSDVISCSSGVRGRGIVCKK